MNSVYETIIELLYAIFPDSDAGKITVVAILACLILILKDKFPIERIFKVVRHCYRWGWNCKIQDSHRWEPAGLTVRVDIQTGLQGGIFRCVVCNKYKHREGVV